jgi:hypothetical protein
VKGEIRSADVEGAAAAAPLLADALAGYLDHMRFNLDETGLYWRLLPLKTLAAADDSAEGFKLSKERITLVIVTNAAGYFEVCIMQSDLIQRLRELIVSGDWQSKTTTGFPWRGASSHLPCYKEVLDDWRSFL